MLEVFSLLITFIIALGIVALIYWAVMKVLGASGITLPPLVVAIIQIIFAVVAIAVLVAYGLPLVQALIP